MDPPNTPENWYKNLPIVTKIIVTTIFIVTVAVVLGLFTPAIMLLDFGLITARLHLWRLFTNFFWLGGFSIHWIFQMYFLCHFSTRLENNEVFKQEPGDYLFFILIQMLTLDVLSLVLEWPRGMPVLGPSLSFAIIYYWSKREPFSYLSYWGFSLQSYQFPFALMFLNILMGGSVWTDLLGLASGHLYYFVKEILPGQYDISFISTPGFLHSAVQTVAEKVQPRGNVIRMQPQQAQAQAGGGFFGGRGHRLGGD
uniref:Derlin n=2 Tax=Chromera velia TaxID=505693 RepID=W8PY29_9ALVE|nr:Der1 [Chromera velia]|mmetsp:Transcript_5943/g.11798  ORF Transcript_5943/g.11798 Transcript_5943/m.11798 type:complete len:254 (+) Transcript_5943:221-982(+)|eukprot:Cvel_16028.t1-p1 / transcript=Cvel_16028.t1 / gene=Cvel_16028 / organism=Chromera_velia_CCMP2878 / gene_product=Probable derlin-2 homolog, putative / transcript_product=Probable derlin-2 homolog, putative / location=Cvel_scaffold1216:44059-47838(+) / protein_length=253 / sequence_SO=supercontig / SO=protein_coding / is_pseudo=false